MIDPLNAVFQAGALNNTLFPTTSRYHGLASKKIEKSDGKTIIYLERRFLPPPENFAVLQEHIVTEGERLDNITAHYLSDPTQFWQICDANRAMWPDELTETIGHRILITLPEGIPGVPNA